MRSLPGRIDRRRLVSASIVGSAATVASGRPLLARSTTRHSVAAVTAQDEPPSVPMFRGDAARSGVMPGPGPDASNGVEILWAFETDGYIDWQPVVVDGVVYVPVLNVGLCALKVSDGEEIRRFISDLPIWLTPAVVADVVYVTSTNGPIAEDFILALNIDDGAERWRIGPGHSFTSPIVVDGVLYSSAGSSGVYALREADGSELWRFEPGSVVNTSPAVGNGIVYVGDIDGVLYAIDAATGESQWQYETGSEGFTEYSCAAVTEGVVYFGALDNNLYAINTTDGTELWRFNAGQEDYDTHDPAIANGMVFIRSGFKFLYALNASDGTELWRFSTDDEESITNPVIANGIVYLGSGDGTLYALDAQSGVEQWRYAVDAKFHSSPAVIDGIIFIGGATGTLFAIGAKVPRLEIGSRARVTETTSLRGGPASTAVERAELATDIVVTITGESEVTGDVTWWPVTVDDTDAQGWVDASKLEPLTNGAK